LVCLVGSGQVEVAQVGNGVDVAGFVGGDGVQGLLVGAQIAG
jgi:hypothetical protein